MRAAAQPRGSQYFASADINMLFLYMSSDNCLKPSLFLNVPEVFKDYDEGNIQSLIGS